MEFLSAKLGRCRRCIRIAESGTVASWIVFVVAYIVAPNAVVFAVTLVIAASFTVVLFAHLVAFVARHLKLGHPPDPRSRQSLHSFATKSITTFPPSSSSRTKTGGCRSCGSKKSRKAVT